VGKGWDIVMICKEMPYIEKPDEILFIVYAFLPNRSGGRYTVQPFSTSSMLICPFVQMLSLISHALFGIA